MTHPIGLDDDESPLGSARHQVKVMEQACAALAKRAEQAERRERLAMSAAAQAHAERELMMSLRDDAAQAHEVEAGRRREAERALEEIRLLTVPNTPNGGTSARCRRIQKIIARSSESGRREGP